MIRYTISFMHQNLVQKIESILASLNTEEDLQALQEAKKSYFELTGEIHQDEESYENKMQRFNDWYLFSYTTETKKVPAILDYFAKSTDEELYKEAFETSRVSIFEFTKTSFKKQIVLRDLISREKITLVKEHSSIGVIQGDFFSGRILKHDGNYYLLPSIGLFPQEVKSAITKHAKKIGKLGSKEEELRFLLKCENLKTKSLRYGHVGLDKIYVFDSK